MSTHPIVSEECSYYCQGLAHGILVLVQRIRFDRQEQSNDLLLHEARDFWRPRGWDIRSVRPAEIDTATLVREWCQKFATLDYHDGHDGTDHQISPSAIATLGTLIPYLYIMEPLCPSDISSPSMGKPIP